MTATRELRSRPEAAPTSERQDAALTGRWEFPSERGQRWHGVYWHLADAALAVGLLGAVVTLGNLHHMPHGLTAFLAVRVSVKNLLLLVAFGIAWPAVMMACGLYAPGRVRSGEGDWLRLVLAGAVGCGLAMVFPLTSRSGLVGPWHVFFFGVVVVPAAGLLRATVRGVDRHRHLSRPRHVVIVGSGPIAARIYGQLLSEPLRNVTIVGFVDSEPQPALARNGAGHLGGVEDLERILMRRVVDDVLIALPVKSRYDEIRQSIEACARVGVPASYPVDLFGGESARRSAVRHGAPVFSLSHLPRPELLAVKRVMDVVGAIVLLVLLSPVMLGVAIAIKLTSPGPVLFGQQRYGYMKRLFRMYKFRTMVAGAEQLQEQLEHRNEASGPAFKIRDDPRVTRLGRFLRRTSLDELPQLWHVLTGEMSLVGPRPMATRDVGLFPEPWLMRRFSVRPGLTCLWQVSGRSNLGFDRWIALDLQYIDGWSLGLDMRILLWTVPAVLRRTGAR